MERYNSSGRIGSRSIIQDLKSYTRTREPPRRTHELVRHVYGYPQLVLRCLRGPSYGGSKLLLYVYLYHVIAVCLDTQRTSFWLNEYLYLVLATSFALLIEVAYLYQRLLGR